tara:strand:+ start:857 stop:1114 length:258 start_codon:yes stop_codon:yes gene_type:complete
MEEQEFLNMSMSLRLRDISVKFGQLQLESVDCLTESLKLTNNLNELCDKQILLKEKIVKLIKDLDNHELANGKELYLQETANASN